ncbi:MAG: SMP-30/gluconolactonase/LRE family protein, partial [Candidatus Binatia bacterium]
AEEGCLLFSDIPANRIYKLTGNGRVSAFRDPSGNSNGLTRDLQGRLVACEHGNRRVTRSEKNGSITVLADQYQGRRLNSPNDVVVKSDGTIYFTDPPCGIKPHEQEQSHQGVFRLLPDGSDLKMVAADFLMPNGLAFSPDERKLYIGDSKRRHMRVFDVEDSGTLSNGRVFHNMDIDIPGAPDGMKVDVQGNIYCTGAGGVWVFSPLGTHLGTIVTPEKPSNCAWGGEDFRRLYITAEKSVYKIQVNVPGHLSRSA